MKLRVAVNYGVGVFCLFTLLVVCSAGAGWAEVGVTDDEIKVGAILDLSGPIAFMGTAVSEGAQIYFDYINDRGGIHGRTIRMVMEDDGYQSPRAVQAVRKLVNRDRVFCMFLVLGSVQSHAMYPFLEANRIPLAFPATQTRSLVFPPRRYLFLGDTTYTELAKIAVEWTVEQMGVKQPKMAVLYQDDAPGHDWLRGVRIAADHYNLRLLELSYRRGATDFGPQVARCKDAGITHIYMYTIVREPAMILKEAQRQRYRATYWTSIASMDKIVLDLAGDAVAYAEGFYGAGLVYTLEDPTPELALYMENNARYGPNDLDNSLYCYGYTNAVNLVEGLMRAGPRPTREGFVAALETFDGFESGLAVPLTFGPDRRDGARGTTIGKAVDGEWILISGREPIVSTIDRD